MNVFLDAFLGAMCGIFIAIMIDTFPWRKDGRHTFIVKTYDDKLAKALKDAYSDYFRKKDGAQ